MIKWIGPILLLLVLGFGIASFFLRKLVPVMSMALIVAVFLGLICTVIYELREQKHGGGVR
jgi:hypothetical protein